MTDSPAVTHIVDSPADRAPAPVWRLTPYPDVTGVSRPEALTFASLRTQPPRPA